MTTNAPVVGRQTCPECGKIVPLRRDGSLRQHYVYRPQAEQEPEAGRLGRVRVCGGTGR